ncbi:hypothetical protein J2T10_004486 [Paenarthrobacter nicotinovorans]|jgi:hypothetical protein|uniref:Uncharacterized protein n=1 Tax=Paenarthrobacter nicotinovorans TaxID=29320 RepID=A0ABT9TSZ5_PAENI|nr:hypothetical protein [Paenarthrobacter nicotinovorans]GAT89654.1 hypothetical protein CVCC1112_4313 [Paenarthrobacter nicotinovorans]
MTTQPNQCPFRGNSDSAPAEASFVSGSGGEAAAAVKPGTPE